MSQQILIDTESYIKSFFNDNIDPKYLFHDLDHTVQTVAAAILIAEGCEMDERNLMLLQLAGWFHDTGYTNGPTDHEERSCTYADQYLRGKIATADLEEIMGLIRATKVPQQPKNLIQQVICDADLSHLGMESYWDRTGKLRHEFIVAQNNVMSEQDWVDFELNFLLVHEYHTPIAQEMFNKRKGKHIQQLVKQKRRLNPDKAPTAKELALMDDKDKSGSLSKVLKDSAQEMKQDRMGRGVETMYRTTYRTHTALSQMADSKANLMLSVNAIVISILVSNLIPKLMSDAGVNMRLAIPTGILTMVCLGSMIFATLSTRPKVTEGKVTLEAIKQRKANLLFFGNFYNMSLEDFQWGVNEMLKDPEFLYSSMSRDLYYLGIVLAKKYLYLSICYNIFMYGLIISMLAFGISFAI